MPARAESLPHTFVHMGVVIVVGLGWFLHEHTVMQVPGKTDDSESLPVLG